MKLNNKYHGSGRLYTQKERYDRASYCFPLYIYYGYSPDQALNMQGRGTLFNMVKPYKRAKA